jgi:hypothetical protein
MISTKKKRTFALILLSIFLKLSVVLCLIYLIYVWTCQPSAVVRNKYDASHFANIFSPMRNPKEFSGDECRIARHFTIDTLPGLMQRGLIMKYERHQTGTLLHVAGKLWKKRSRYFKESLLAEVLIYNKVNGYAVETLVVDHSSQRLYAKVSPSEIKEVFD